MMLLRDILYSKILPWEITWYLKRKIVNNEVTQTLSCIGENRFRVMGSQKEATIGFEKKNTPSDSQFFYNIATIYLYLGMWQTLFNRGCWILQ